MKALTPEQKMKMVAWAERMKQNQNPFFQVTDVERQMVRQIEQFDKDGWAVTTDTKTPEPKDKILILELEQLKNKQLEIDAKEVMKNQERTAPIFH
jgi:hypothetical protein